MRQAANERAHFDIAMEPILAGAPDLFSARWLMSPFEASIWHAGADFAFTIDFRVCLEDGSLLTAPKNCELLNTIKHFLLAQTDAAFTKGILYADKSLRARLLAAIHICEYLLMRSDEFKLGAFGLRTITEADALKMLKRFAEEEAADSVYEWHDRLSRLLVAKGEELAVHALNEASSARPSIGWACACPRLGMSAQQIVKARAWLWLNGLYKTAVLDGSHVCGLDSGKIIELLYPRGTLKNNWTRPRVAELELPAGPPLRRELRGRPVRGQERSVASIRLYRRAIRALPRLESVSIYVPRAIVDAGENIAFLQGLHAKPVGRYATLPVSTVLSAVRNAVEFLLENADDLIAAYVSFAQLGIRESLNPFDAAEHLGNVIGPRLEARGVCSWSVAHDVRVESCSEGGDMTPIAAAEFFSRLRRNEGLYELLQVLYGSLLVTLGALMARRQGELIDLKIGKLFDRSGTRLAFLARKRNEREIREELHRPAPPVLVEILRAFERMHEQLSRIGLPAPNDALMSSPRMNAFKLSEPRDDILNLALDRFCDYFEIDCDSLGQRLYIRQHQLRRFFALLFFWGNSFGGLETLRWFLGHADPEQLYRYITETTPGEVLRSAKIDYVIERIHEHDASAEAVVEILRERFEVDAVQLLDAAELADYLDELLSDESLVVEPHFFSTHAGNEYMIMIIVKRRAA